MIVFRNFFGNFSLRFSYKVSKISIIVTFSLDICKFMDFTKKIGPQTLFLLTTMLLLKERMHWSQPGKITHLLYPFSIHHQTTKEKGISLLQHLFLLFHFSRTSKQPFNGLFSRTTWVSRYQKGKTNLDFTGAISRTSNVK